jgi:hypothetical protein
VGPEAKLLRETQRYATAHGVPCIRLVFHRGIAAGWPDLLLLIPGGKPLWLELKAPTGKLTALQTIRYLTLSERGYNVAVAYNINDARTAIARALDAARLPASRVNIPQ